MKRLLVTLLALLIGVGLLLFAGIFFSGGRHCLPFEIFCADSA